MLADYDMGLHWERMAEISYLVTFQPLSGTLDRPAGSITPFAASTVQTPAPSSWRSRSIYVDLL